MRRLLLLVPLALALAGCGGDSASVSAGSPEPTARYLASAAATSTAVDSMKVDTETTMTLPGSDKPATMKITGVVDNVAHRTRMTMDMSALLGGLGLSADDLKGSDELNAEMIGDFGEGKLDLYMRFALLSAMAGGGKEWIKMDLQKAGKAAGFDISALAGAGNDPTQQLDWLRATSDDVTEVGKEEIDGVETTHYRATVDVDKYVNLVPAEKRAAVRKTLDALAKAGAGTTYPIEVWIGEDGLIRKYKTTTSETIQGQSIETETTARYYDFGEPVEVDLPPADKVEELSDFSGMGG